MIPFYDHTNDIKGCQIIKIYQPNEKELTLKIIGLYDEDQNNIYTYKTDILEYGYQKFYNNNHDMSNYTIVLAAKIRSKFVNCYDPIFDNNEILIMLQRTISKIRSMRPMKFRFVIMNASFKEQKKKHFFICREFFSGKSLCDICLNDPFAILDAMKFNKQTLNDVLKNEGCIIDELLQGFGEKIFKNYRLINLRESGTIITCDFNFITQI